MNTSRTQPLSVAPHFAEHRQPMSPFDDRASLNGMEVHNCSWDEWLAVQHQMQQCRELADGQGHRARLTRSPSVQ